MYFSWITGGFGALEYSLYLNSALKALSKHHRAEHNNKDQIKILPEL